jgi:hypothetical protein
MFRARAHASWQPLAMEAELGWDRGRPQGSQAANSPTSGWRVIRADQGDGSGVSLPH